MKLYLVRHGDYVLNALNQDILSEKGVNEIERLAQFLEPLHLHVVNLFHSSKIRAEQTAALLAKSIQSERPIEEQSGLNPNDAVVPFAIDVGASDEDTLAVGHLPFMSKLVGYLVTGNENKEIVYFDTGTIVCLETEDGSRWIIRWSISPAFIP